MTDLLRQEIARTADTIVVKVGTRVLTRGDGTLNRERMAGIAEQLHGMIGAGRRVVMVSSGAVGSGMHRLGLRKRPTDLSRLQAVAAVGQSALVEAYDQTFRQYQRHAAQVLLTADSLDRRSSYLNVRNTILALLEYGTVPIINENDTVAVDELMTTFGDNDRLAALVTNLIGASLLIILSDVDGLYDHASEASNPKVVSTVTKLDESVFALVRDTSSGLSKGGMSSKLEAARLVTTAGENVIIASGHDPTILQHIMAGKQVGTLIAAQGKTISPWKRWIGLAVQPRGFIRLDTGACRAVEQNGRSLLAIGIVSVEGDFSKGDVVSLQDEQGRDFARGLINYSKQEIDQIRGLKSHKISEVLGHLPYEEVIHRDNMVVLTRK